MKYIMSKLHSHSAMQEGTVHMTPAQEKSFRREGYRVVLGGVFLHFVLGTFYLWGGISLYVASYLRSFDKAADIDLVKIVFPFMFAAINCALSFGVKLADKIGHKVVCFLGMTFIAAAAFIVSFIQNYIIFIVVYTLMVGLSSGMVYMVPVVCGWKYFPQHKGLISGTIIAGYGFGSFSFNLIALQLVNPNNETASVEYNDHKYFTEDVYSRVPYMFRILALLYLIIGYIGVLLLKNPKTLPTEHHDEHDVLTKVGHKKLPQHEHHDPDTIKEGVKSSAFTFLFLMSMAGSFFGLLMANNYKVYGLEKLGSDSFVTLVGSIGSVSNGCSRLIWATLYDKFGFKRVYFVLMVIQCAMAATLNIVSGTKILYLVWHSLIMATEGGQFSIMPSVTAKVFGPKQGSLIYGIIYVGFTIANISSFFLTKFTLKTLGWAPIFWICFGLSVCAFVLNLFFKEDYNFEDHSKAKGNIELGMHHDTHEMHESHEHDNDHHMEHSPALKV